MFSLGDVIISIYQCYPKRLNGKQLVTCCLAITWAKLVFKQTKWPFKQSKQPIKQKRYATV
jgi:hypothetical protein